MKTDQDTVFDLIIRDLQDKKSAIIDYQNKNKPVVAHKITVDLGTARAENDPMVVNFSFRSVYVQTATDPAALIYLKPVTKEDLQPAIEFNIKDSWSVDHQISKAFLHWPAQVGKTVTLMFFPQSEFRSGSQLSVNSGGFTLNDGSAFTLTNLALPQVAATQLVASNFNRKVATIKNETVGSIFIGANNVTDGGATKGFEITPTETFQWRNTSALYAYGIAAGNVQILEET